MRTGPLLHRDDLAGTALALRVDSLLVRQDGRWVALLPLTGVEDPAALWSLLSSAAIPGVALLDLKSEADALVAGYRAQSIRSTLLGLACIVAVVWLGMRSLPATLRLLAPVLAAVLLTAAALVATGQRLTVFHLVALLLVVGVGLNYALFFGRQHASTQERDLTLLSVMVAGLATLCAALTLSFTGTPVLRAIGITAALGSVFAFVVSAMLSREAR
jgi:predicted exporter